MTLIEYAARMEKSSKAHDLAIAKYIRTHIHRLNDLVNRFAKTRADRDELMQVALLACCERALTDDPEVALKNIHNAMQRYARHEASWRIRKFPLMGDEDETFSSNNKRKNEEN